MKMSIQPENISPIDPAKVNASDKLGQRSNIPTDPPLRRQIILDGIHPRDFRELNLIYSCEQCSYFSSHLDRCAMGFKVEKHKRENQLKLYNLTGKMAICRSQEID